ncbi:hypothetical protein HGB07_04690, partial [Candidatus Roizmanbacteria bacterium]|nr:hypothetical protein [Candidatus Roizmanbacteria bacterium]
MKYRKGEIGIFVAFGALIFLGVSTIIGSVFLNTNNKIGVRSRAASNNCNNTVPNKGGYCNDKIAYICSSSNDSGTMLADCTNIGDGKCHTGTDSSGQVDYIGCNPREGIVLNCTYGNTTYIDQRGGYCEGDVPKICNAGSFTRLNVNGADVTCPSGTCTNDGRTDYIGCSGTAPVSSITTSSVIPSVTPVPTATPLRNQTPTIHVSRNCTYGNTTYIDQRGGYCEGDVPMICNGDAFTQLNVDGKYITCPSGTCTNDGRTDYIGCSGAAQTGKSNTTGNQQQNTNSSIISGSCIRDGVTYANNKGGYCSDDHNAMICINNNFVPFVNCGTNYCGTREDRVDGNGYRDYVGCDGKGPQASSGLTSTSKSISVLSQKSATSKEVNANFFLELSKCDNASSTYIAIKNGTEISNGQCLNNSCTAAMKLTLDSTNPKVTVTGYALITDNDGTIHNISETIELNYNDASQPQSISRGFVCGYPVLKEINKSISQGSGSPFGLNVNLIGRYVDDRSVINEPLNMVKGTGASWLRLEFNWASLQTDVGNPTGAFNWTNTDAVVQSVKDKGFNILGLLAYNSLGRNQVFPVDDNGCNGNCEENWKKYLTAVVSRYKDSITHWQIWNEPDTYQFNHNAENGNSPSRYSYLLKVSQQIIKQIQPNAKIVMGGFNPDTPEWAYKVMAEGGSNYVDVVDVHPYITYSNLSPEANYWIEKEYPFIAMSKQFGKELWATEFGWPTQHYSNRAYVSPNTQGEYIARAYIQGIANGFSKLFLFKYNDDPGSDADGQFQTFGLVNTSWLQSKGSYETYVNMTNALNNSVIVAKYDPTYDPSYSNSSKSSKMDTFEQGWLYNQNSGSVQITNSESLEKHNDLASMSVTYTLNSKSDKVTIARSSNHEISIPGNATKFGFWVKNNSFNNPVISVILRDNNSGIYEYEIGRLSVTGEWTRYEVDLQNMQEVGPDGEALRKVNREHTQFVGIGLTKTMSPAANNSFLLSGGYFGYQESTYGYIFRKNGESKNIQWKIDGNVPLP